MSCLQPLTLSLKFVGGFKFSMPEEDGNAVPVTDIKFKVRFALQ